MQNNNLNIKLTIVSPKIWHLALMKIAFHSTNKIKLHAKKTETAHKTSSFSFRFLVLIFKFRQNFSLANRNKLLVLNSEFVQVTESIPLIVMTKLECEN